PRRFADETSPLSRLDGLRGQLSPRRRRPGRAPGEGPSARGPRLPGRGLLRPVAADPAPPARHGGRPAALGGVGRLRHKALPPPRRQRRRLPRQERGPAPAAAGRALRRGPPARPPPPAGPPPPPPPPPTPPP